MTAALILALHFAMNTYLLSFTNPVSVPCLLHFKKANPVWGFYCNSCRFFWGGGEVVGEDVLSHQASKILYLEWLQFLLILWALCLFLFLRGSSSHAIKMFKQSHGEAYLRTVALSQWQTFKSSGDWHQPTPSYPHTRHWANCLAKLLPNSCSQNYISGSTFHWSFLWRSWALAMNKGEPELGRQRAFCCHHSQCVPSVTPDEAQMAPATKDTSLQD